MNSSAASPGGPQQHRQAAPSDLSFAVLTVSDSRTEANDRSGEAIVQAMQQAGHRLVMRRIVPDEVNSIREAVGDVLAEGGVDVLMVTGGTGIAPRDRTPEAIGPLLETELPGFGELFRMLSYQEIGPAAMLSRAVAGRVGSMLVFCLPGSTGAVRLALDKLLIPELPHLVLHSRR